ncbi:hypothetical protein ACGFY7_43900 [Streptomyces prunicolor]|uniref:hypothetical protein n=1 Tax=Streptomyces prunicolor TaxID=67348 RepID=UPI0037216F01
MILAATTSAGSAGLGIPRSVRAGVLDVAYSETGPAVLLLHGFPYDVQIPTATSSRSRPPPG